MTRKSFLSVLAIAVFMAFAVASSEDGGSSDDKYQIISEEVIGRGNYLAVKIKNTGDKPIRSLSLKYSCKLSDGTSQTRNAYFYDVQPGDIAKDDNIYCDGSIVSFKRLEK